MNYILSIIIPIYNVEKYIKECIDSITAQITDDIEVILVNDGTPDNSMKIIRSNYSKYIKNGQFKIIEQKNLGPSAARNNGIKNSTGKHIGFLDSDDVLLENYFISILEILDNNDCDIIEFTYKRFTNLQKINEKKEIILYPYNGSYKLTSIRENIFATGVWFPCIRIYKKELFDSISFPEGRFYEDLICISQIYLKDLNVFFFPKALLGYRDNPNSTTNIHKANHIKDMMYYYEQLKNYKNSRTIDIQKIRTARSIGYFYTEFDASDIDMKSILNDIKYIKKDFKILKNLKKADLLFFIFPNIYMFINKLRIKKQGIK